MQINTTAVNFIENNLLAVLAIVPLALILAGVAVRGLRASDPQSREVILFQNLRFMAHIIEFIIISAGLIGAYLQVSMGDRGVFLGFLFFFAFAIGESVKSIMAESIFRIRTSGVYIAGLLGLIVTLYLTWENLGFAQTYLNNISLKAANSIIEDRAGLEVDRLKLNENISDYKLKISELSKDQLNFSQPVKDFIKEKEEKIRDLEQEAISISESNNKSKKDLLRVQLLNLDEEVSNLQSEIDTNFNSYNSEAKEMLVMANTSAHGARFGQRTKARDIVLTQLKKLEENHNKASANLKRLIQSKQEERLKIKDRLLELDELSPKNAMRIRDIDREIVALRFSLNKHKEEIDVEFSKTNEEINDLKLKLSADEAHYASKIEEIFSKDQELLKAKKDNWLFSLASTVLDRPIAEISFEEANGITKVFFIISIVALSLLAPILIYLSVQIERKSLGEIQPIEPKRIIASAYHSLRNDYMAKRRSDQLIGAKVNRETKKLTRAYETERRKYISKTEAKNLRDIKEIQKSHSDQRTADQQSHSEQRAADQKNYQTTLNANKQEITDLKQEKKLLQKQLESEREKHEQTIKQIISDQKGINKNNPQPPETSINTKEAVKVYVAPPSFIKALGVFNSKLNDKTNTKDD